MLIKNSFRLLMENFKNVYKVLLYKLIVGLVALALCSAMVLPEVFDIWENPVTQQLLAESKELIRVFFSADEEAIARLKDSVFGAGGLIEQFSSVVWSRAAEIALTTAGCVLVALVKRFADALCHFALGSVINDKMEKYAETRLSIGYVANFKKACKYALVYVPYAFAFDVAFVLVALVCLRFFGMLYALSLSITLLVVLQSLKFMWAGHWMPAMITDNKSLGKALRSMREVPVKYRGRTFSNYLVLVYGVIIINVAAAVCTVGSALLLSIPMSYMLFVCMHFVQYYTVKGKKYFIRFDTISENYARGDDANIMEYISQA